MKISNISYQILIVLSVTVTLCGEAIAQDTGRTIGASILKEYPESLYIRTDRDIYITGEQVWLKIYKLSGLNGNPMDLSKIIYVELVDNLGNPVYQVKLRIDGTSGPGSFRLADTLGTGSYLLRAYTRWMLNQPESSYFHKALTIVNPYKNIERLGAQVLSDVVISGDPQTGENINSLNRGRSENSFIISAASDRDNYKPREPVRLEIKTTEPGGKPVGADLSVSVVKDFLVDSTCVLISDTAAAGNSSGYMFDRRENLPEMEGELIRGIIRDKASNEPLKNTGISLSLVGRTARCLFSETDENGEFLFVVKNVSGLNEVVIQPVIKGDEEFYVEIYQPFENIFSRLHPGSIRPDRRVVEGINNAVISRQVNGTYEQFIQETPMQTDTTEMTSFYGKPVRTVRLADFIDLTNIREVVRELLPEVTAVKKDKKSMLMVVSSNRFEQFENQPLVLVDGVPVFDIEQLLNANSKDFERIDIFNTRYFISGFVFEGVISFFTKKGDLSILNTNYSGFRQVFEGCTVPQKFNSPDYSADSLKNSRIPDFRNTLYWDPSLLTSVNGASSVSFYTSDEKGDYLIIIDGITNDGRRSSLRIPFRVR